MPLPTHHTLSAAGLNVLVVDDNIMTISIVKAMLEEMHFGRIDSASNGRDGWDKISDNLEKGRPYDIVVMDWNMPEMNGYEALRRCRDETRLNKMAIIMLSAESQKRNILEATKAGATSYIIKPLEKSEFNEKMKQVFAWIEKNRGAS